MRTPASRSSAPGSGGTAIALWTEGHFPLDFGKDLVDSPAVQGWGEDQCWTLARITGVVCRWFKVEYTVAGMDLLLHRIGWSVQVPARRAAERDEAAIAAWREETWPTVKGRRRTWAPGSVSKTSLARA